MFMYKPVLTAKCHGNDHGVDRSFNHCHTLLFISVMKILVFTVFVTDQDIVWQIKITVGALKSGNKH